MSLFLWSIGALAVAGILSVLVGRRPSVAGGVAVSGTILSAMLAIPPCLRVLLLGIEEELRIPWEIPGGSFFVRLDALSAFFALPILVIAPLCALYGIEYLRAHGSQRSIGSMWCFFELLVASMLLVLVAHNAMLFLIAWEVMALVSFFLVAFDDEKPEVRHAAWVYILAAHLGVAALLAMFAILGGGAEGFDFTSFGRGLGPGTASAVFVLAVAGFGSKAGFAPFHVWLPEAHPAAPSHVSAVMSGLMIKTGIYGLIRVLLYLGTPPLWWGWTLLVIGLLSGAGGVLFALAQHSLKRLLAYHSVENIGIIALGLGLGLVGWSTGFPLVSVLGFSGALLHVLNHAIFKSLLFLGAGAVLHTTGTPDMDHLGGLLKRMPHTGATFAIGSAAISGLPPFNGFVSEFLIFLGALSGLLSSSPAVLAASGTVIVGLALISGLASACFTKAFGVVFLGASRSTHGDHAQEAGWRMRVAMWFLSCACLAIGLVAPFIIAPLAGVVAVLRPELTAELPALYSVPTKSLQMIVIVSVLFLAVIAVLTLVRFMLLRKRTVARALTWDCGYAAPTARMQYTSASFAQPLTALFRTVLRSRCDGTRVVGMFPGRAAHGTTTPDLAMVALYRPVAAAITWMVARLRWLQHGNIHLYVLYVAATLLLLLIWKLR